MQPVVETSNGSHRICLVDPTISIQVHSRYPVKNFDLENLPGPAEVRQSFYILVLSDSLLRDHSDRVAEWLNTGRHHTIRIILLSPYDHPYERYRPVTPEYFYLLLPEAISGSMLEKSILSAFEHVAALEDRISLLSSLGRSYQEIQRLTTVGQSLASERDFDTLIGSILKEARELVRADAGSIYVTQRSEPGIPPSYLIFKKSALDLNGKEFILQINKNSIAGYVALTGEPLVIDDAYALTGEEEYHFNKEFDKKIDYYSRSMLVIPMKNHRDEVIGVIQLINKKKDYSEKLTIAEMQGEGVIPFSARDVELAMALAGQAAVSIENNQLVQDISNLFEGFVRASVSAIEQRDPTTSGHSFRVAELSTGLAKAVDRDNNSFTAVRFTQEQVRELRYASLLHDFGKVGVREHVLVKSKKLYPSELDTIRWRFKYVRKSFEAKFYKKKIEYMEKHGRKGGYREWSLEQDEKLRQHLEALDRMLEIVESSNEPTILSEHAHSELDHIARNRVKIDGDEFPLLEKPELLSLQVLKGNLNEDERNQIMLHVTNTYNFLIQIPWTSDLQNVPEIALSHHEKMNGKGYPFGMDATEIMLQTRIMTISDIFDALTAADRPYKKGLPAEKALDILSMEAKEGLLDERLLRVFIESGIFRVIENFKR